MTWIKRLALLCAAVAATAFVSPPTPALAFSKAELKKRIASALLHAGSSSGAFVSDLSTGEALYAVRADTARVPASNEKLYTTATALGRFGANARFATELLRSGSISSSGLLSGDLILRGGGDPTLSSDDISSLALATTRAGIKRISGAVVGDESQFDSRRGGPASGWGIDGYIGGSLSALALNRGSGDYKRPALASAAAFAKALGSYKIKLGAVTRTGAAPKTAQPITTVNSPTMSELIKMTNSPSDNFLAEMLIKDLGARFGIGGTTNAGAGVMRAFLKRFGITPQISDGSGLSRGNSTAPREVVALLTGMHKDPQHAAYENSLAVAGRSGTLAGRMNGSAAEGTCRGKTGTLSGVSALSGLCTAKNGHVIVFSMLMSGLSNGDAHSMQDKAVKAIAGYSG